MKEQEMLKMVADHKVSKVYELAVGELNSDWGNQYDDFRLERPTNEFADTVLSDILNGYAFDMYADEQLTMEVYIIEKTVKYDEYRLIFDNKILYSNKKTVTGYNQ